MASAFCLTLIMHCKELNISTESVAMPLSTMPLGIKCDLWYYSIFKE
jgi:hypothetical protein